MTIWSDPATLANLIMALAAVSSLFATVALYYKSQKEQRKLEGKLASYSAHLSAFELLSNIPKAIRFLGVSNEDLNALKKEGIKPEEAVFLFIHFRAFLYFEKIIKTDDKSAYGPGTANYITLSVPETRAAWKILRKSMPSSIFMEKLDSTVQLIESEKLYSQ